MKCLKQNNLGAEEIIIYERKYWEGQECKWRQAKIDSVPQNNSLFTAPSNTQTVTLHNLLELMNISLHPKCWCKWSLLLLDVWVSEPTLVLWSPKLHFFVLKSRKCYVIGEEGFYLCVKIFWLRLFPSAVKWNIGAFYTENKLWVSSCCKR